MTRWIIRCTRCGVEKQFNVAFDLTIYGSSIWLYCKNCKANTEHKVLGFIDDDTERFVHFDEAVTIKFRSV
ncbi:MAG: hypothetical protein B6V02_00880 [Thermoprotei archaeon ex4572_64]|nr:MAG: hypothetical protein B6V02_00880 [Thermoprotei archaeon ex4572_64]